MSVQQEKVMDVIGIDKRTAHVILTISDPLDWQDSIGHQFTRQRKFNSYLAFVESGEILQPYPDARNRLVRFRAFFKYPPDQDSEIFWTRAKKSSNKLGSV